MKQDMEAKSVGKRGPRPGEGGRPRKPKGSHAKNSEGYKRVTVGSKANPKRIYEHQVGMPKGGSKGSSMVIDHRDGNKSNNKRSNLRMMKRGKNAKRGK